MQINATVIVDELKLWQAVWGAPTRPFWVTRVDSVGEDDVFVEGTAWQATPRVFCVHDLDGQESNWVSVRDLCMAYAKAVVEGVRHCGKSPFDYNDPDACFGEDLLQYAIYDKLVWG